jgi:hypothetical protein
MRGVPGPALREHFKNTPGVAGKQYIDNDYYRSCNVGGGWSLMIFLDVGKWVILIVIRLILYLIIN